jgi:hypothetical protein
MYYIVVIDTDEDRVIVDGSGEPRLFATKAKASRFVSGRLYLRRKKIKITHDIEHVTGSLTVDI